MCWILSLFSCESEHSRNVSVLVKRSVPLGVGNSPCHACLRGMTDKGRTLIYDPLY